MSGRHSDSAASELALLDEEALDPLETCGKRQIGTISMFLKGLRLLESSKPGIDSGKTRAVQGEGPGENGSERLPDGSSGAEAPASALSGSPKHREDNSARNGGVSICPKKPQGDCYETTRLSRPLSPRPSLLD